MTTISAGRCLAMDGYPTVTRVKNRGVSRAKRDVPDWFGSKRPVAPNPGDRNVGRWLSLVERPVWDREAAGSNPAFSTIHISSEEHDDFIPADSSVPDPRAKLVKKFCEQQAGARINAA
jgi:hypothetical protein